MSATCGYPLSDGGFCTFPPHNPSAHPHGRSHTPGEPCQFCAKPTPLDGNACPDCWTHVSNLTFADLKGLFAEADLSLARGSEPTP